ncbi:hypothetical protein COCVIDRAFT_39790 [Bipolaris victoriae FI3]|uniref:Uncharacterized protein n=1 Tax=Bipolaris victoriae (strain FI3) TaxID=930091 RepID=W7EK83_BIPV3|nr:hypothetical protein COCVIDRAFT_39790 [Bipolaris victoriae FI3]
MAVPRRLSDRRWGSASRCRDEADSVFGQQQRGIRSVQGTRAREQAGRDYAMIRPSLSLAFPQGRCNQGTQYVPAIPRPLHRHSTPPNLPWPCSDVGFVVTRSQPITRPISATLHIGSSRCAIRPSMPRAHNPPLALSCRGGRHAAAKKGPTSLLDTRVCPTGSLCKTSIPQWTNMPHHPRRDVSTATPCPAWTSPHP